jgi:hypothetical protein
MRTSHLLGSLLLAVSSATVAAPPPQYLFVDDSSPILIDTASALAVWQGQVDDNMRMRLRKVYPVSKWGFVSQVQGGFTTDGVCVVTARAVLVPRVLGSRLVFKPQRSATAFASKPSATQAECRSLASAKLKDAVVAVRTALINAP